MPAVLERFDERFVRDLAALAGFFRRLSGKGAVGGKYIRFSFRAGQPSRVLPLRERTFIGSKRNVKYQDRELVAGGFAAVSFVLCVIYGLIVPQSLHAYQFLEAVLPAFK